MNCKQLPAHPINYIELDEIPNLNYAIDSMTARRIDGDLLEALKDLEAKHDAMAKATWNPEDDDHDAAEEAYELWLWDHCYEIAYFNMICREFTPLFAPAKEAA